MTRAQKVEFVKALLSGHADMSVLTGYTINLWRQDDEDREYMVTMDGSTRIHKIDFDALPGRRVTLNLGGKRVL